MLVEKPLFSLFIHKEVMHGVVWPWTKEIMHAFKPVIHKLELKESFIKKKGYGYFKFGIRGVKRCEEANIIGNGIGNTRRYTLVFK